MGSRKYYENPLMKSNNDYINKMLRKIGFDRNHKEYSKIVNEIPDYF